MQRRFILSPISVIAALLAISMLAVVACGGAEEPQTTDPAAGQADAQAGSQPVQQPESSAPEATPTPLPASLPTEVVENAVTKDAYPDAEYGGILRRGGYGDPSHYDLMQVSSVSNSFKQMMLLNGLLRYNPLDAGKTIIADLVVEQGWPDG